MQAQLSEYAHLDGYELFRRAIVERDDQAWAEAAVRYRQLLIAWTGHRSSNATIGERADDIANRALVRAWSALSPERFGQFPNLAAVLAYLRACVTSVVIDCARSEANLERVMQLIEVDQVATPEQIVLDQVDRRELWRIASQLAQSEEERVVLAESYVYVLPPRVILERHPHPFADTTAIYATKRNLLTRLKRCPELLQWYQEWLTV